MRYFLFLFFFYSMFRVQGVFNTYSMFQFGLAPLQEPMAACGSCLPYWRVQLADGQDNSTNLRDPGAKEYRAYDRLQNE